MIDIKKARGLAWSIASDANCFRNSDPITAKGYRRVSNTIRDLADELEKVHEENKWLTRAHMIDTSYLDDDPERIRLQQELVACHTLRDQHKTDLAEALEEVVRVKGELEKLNGEPVNPPIEWWMDVYHKILPGDSPLRPRIAAYIEKFLAKQEGDTDG